VTEVNDQPTANADSKSGTEDNVLTIPATDLTANDSKGPANESGQALSIDSVGNATHGSVSISSGTVTFTPAGDYNGSASFTYHVCDNGTTNGAADPKCDTGTVNLTFAGADDAPDASANSSSQTLQYSDPITDVTISAHDIDSLDSGLTASLAWKKQSDASFTSGALNGLSLTPGPTTSSPRTWTLAGKAQVAAGTYIVQVTVDDATAGPYQTVGPVHNNKVQITLVVNKENATIDYTGDNIGVIGVNLTLKATVSENDSSIGDITKMTVAFDIYAETACGTGSPLTTLTAGVADTGATGDGVGTATTTYTTNTETTDCVIARVTTNNYYDTNQNAAINTITFYKNLGQFVTGGGWVNDSASTNGHGNFGFNARYNSNGKAQGQMVYVWRGTYNGFAADYIIKSNALTALSFTGTTYPLSATLQGGATLQIVRASDGYLLASQGGGSFVATAKDTNGVGADTFALTYTGATLNKSFDTLNLQGGNVVIHLK
jgi:hypothetical protein